MSDMTPRQSWAIFTMSGYDVRDTELDKNSASLIISLLKEGDHEKAEASLETWDGAIKRSSKKSKAQDWDSLYNKADTAGKKAAEDCKPTPMVVQERANPLDDSSPVIKEYEPVFDGVCGFAWINVKPGNHSFANWIKKNDLGSKDGYYGGVTIWVGDYKQSMEKKQAYAVAFANIINEYDDDKLKAMPMSRID